LNNVEAGVRIEQLGAPSEKGELQVFKDDQNEHKNEAQFILVDHSEVN
jgi:hypothetical protein